MAGSRNVQKMTFKDEDTGQRQKEKWSGMDVQARKTPVPKGPAAPGPKGRRECKKWPLPPVKEEIWFMRITSVLVKGERAFRESLQLCRKFW